ncbi:hypothetical protein G7Z17_g7670 [Cylindrodendrum hubeiense]|uniref:Methyltransferase n=1 Tax=Cylindrodendrum hubeiense TaxID=595255 RepID=A0A9P5H7F2_9HYPO|nr:hypothetical protein G7Z17_g7670 [Cylindrodendrum hubeiense]
MADETTPEPGRDSPARATSSAVLVPDNQLQADDDLQDEDSAYNFSEGSGSFLSSLKSSILNYKYEPNDEEEQDRMDLVHHIYTLLLEGKLHLAPIGENVQRVLDLGTGTGIWAMNFAETPPNCTFEVDDFEEEWLYRTPFDFIHARELEGCIGNHDQLFKQAFQRLNPGGYIELQGVTGKFMCDDGTIDKATNALLWMENLCKSAAKFGKPVDTAPHWKEKLSEAGFVDVKQEMRKLPIGMWPKDPKLKEIGKYQSVQELQVVDSYTPRLFAHELGWSAEEVQVFIAKVKKDMKDTSIHLYLPVYFVWGRKP